MKVTKLLAREILDSRGNPTVEVDIELDDEYFGRASVPSGASTGEHEALELRDNESRYHGKGVLKAVTNVNTIIKDSILGKEFTNQEDLDECLIKLDGTNNKDILGANAILGVSLAFFKALAVENNKELYEQVGNERSLPLLMCNILNGGMHADNNLLFQEFMIVPINNRVNECVRMASEVFHSLKSILKSRGLITSVGDEGGFAPNLRDDNEALDVIMKAITNSGYMPGKDVMLALDVAASSFYDNGIYQYHKSLTSLDMINMYQDLVSRYPIVSIEDALDENDWEGFKQLTECLGNKVQLVGDDLFVTNVNLLNKGIESGICNAILIKSNQIGTITETFKAIELAKRNNYNVVISHRSGETEDTFIADLAVGVGAKYIKTGSLSRGERIAKYNRLIRIEEELCK